MNFKRPSSNVYFGEFVLSNLIASPLMKPCFTPGGWHEAKWEGLGRLAMGFDVQVGFFANFSPLNTVASKKVISFIQIGLLQLRHSLG